MARTYMGTAWLEHTWNRYSWHLHQGPLGSLVQYRIHFMPHACCSAQANVSSHAIRPCQSHSPLPPCRKAYAASAPVLHIVTHAALQAHTTTSNIIADAPGGKLLTYIRHPSYTHLAYPLPCLPRVLSLPWCLPPMLSHFPFLF